MDGRLGGPVVEVQEAVGLAHVEDGGVVVDEVLLLLLLLVPMLACR